MEPGGLQSMGSQRARHDWVTHCPSAKSKMGVSDWQESLLLRLASETWAPSTLWSEWKSLICGQLFETPWTIACQAPLSMEFSRQEYSGSAIWHWASRLPEQWGSPSDLTGIFCASGLGVCWSCPPSISQGSGSRSYLNSWEAKKDHLAMCPWRREILPPCNDRQMLHHFLK